MLAIERRNKILETLQQEKKVVVSELSQCYGVSEETIRRDLEKLEKDGLVIKSYGGAVLNERSIFDLPINVRKNKMIAEKQVIAGLVNELVQEGDAIMLDASSTSVYVANQLKEKEKLTVISNSIEVILNLFEKSNWNVISTGGTVLENSSALVGPHADAMLRTYHVDKTIISCKGLTYEGGFMDSDERDSSCKRMMLQAAKEKILVADHSKFGKTAFATVSGWSDIDIVITDQEPSATWMREFERMGIEVIYPGHTRK